MILFDKHDKPVIAGLDEQADWANCEAWESYVYDNAESYSEAGWDIMVKSVCDLYDDFYRKWS
jgi:hypothetical protein